MQLFFYNWLNRLSLLIIIRQHFFNNNFLALDFIRLSDLNSNPNDLVEILFIGVFLVDFLMYLNISLMALKISKPSFVKINSRKLTTNFFFCCFFPFYFCFHFHQSLFRAYNHKIASQSYNLKSCIVFSYFLLQNDLVILVSTDCSFVKITSYCLKLNFLLNLWADLVLKSIIVFTVNFSSIKILLHCLLIQLLFRIYVFYVM